jgi:hypothetical protein
VTANVIIPAHESLERRAALVGLFVVILGLAFAGAILADAALAGAGHAAAGHPDTSAFAIGVPATTSFGSLTIENVQTLDGLDPSVFDNGMAHGIQGLVATDQAQIQASVFLVNSSDRPARLDPRQFQLRVGGVADPILVTGSTLMPTELPSRASLEATLTFVAPRGGTRMSIEFQETAHSAVIAIPAGQIDQAPASAGQHSH